MTQSYDLHEPIEEFPQPSKPVPVPAHQYHAQAELLESAAAGDLSAANQVLSYLTSTLTDLRHIINSVLHQSHDRSIWHCLLTYMAVERWGDWGAVNGEVHLLPALDWKENPHGAAARAITYIFTLDETADEAALKNDLLLQDLEGPESIRNAAAYLLGMRGIHSAIPALAEILQTKTHKKDTLEWQLRAVQALAALHDPNCAAPLIGALATGRGELHRAAGWALTELGRDAQEDLLEALHHPDSHVRWHAARILGQCADASGAHILVEGLYDERPEVRWATANVLAGLDAAAVPYILRALIAHPLNESYRQAVYHSLHGMASHRTQERLQPLLAALRGPAPSVQAPTVAQKLLADWL
jgi:HEAT repeat protein